MKNLLYVAANPEGMDPLRLDAEISTIQEKLLSDASAGLSVAFLPDLDALQFAQVLIKQRPDILHLSAHGREQSLTIRKAGGGMESLTATMLHAWLPDPGPKLIYVNACDSKDFVKQLVQLGRVRLAIGTNDEIENQAARAAAVTFYSRIIAGQSVQHAFDACSNMASFQQKSVGMVLVDPDNTATKTMLRQDPLLVARFVDNPPRPRDGGRFAFQIGIFACPDDTHQVIFFTDDNNFAMTKSLEKNMTTVVRRSPDKYGEFWVPSENGKNWYSRKEVRIFAVGVSPRGKTFVMNATDLSDAVERFFLLTNGGVVPSEIREALIALLPPERLERLFGFGRAATIQKGKNSRRSQDGQRFIDKNSFQVRKSAVRPAADLELERIRRLGSTSKN